MNIENIKEGGWYYCKYGYDINKVKVVIVVDANSVIIEHGSCGTKLVDSSSIVAPCNPPLLTVTQWWYIVYASMPLTIYILYKLLDN